MRRLRLRPAVPSLLPGRPPIRPAAAALAVLLPVAALAAGCGKVGPKAPQAKHDDTIVVAAGAATVTDFDDDVAQAEGFYARHHVRTQYLETQTASQATQLLATGEADVGRGIADAIQANVSTKRQLDYVSVADELVRPPHVLVTKGTTTFANIAAHKIAISSPTDNTTIVTEGVLAGRRYDPEKANLIPAGGTSSRLAALQAGGVKATLLLPPASFRAVRTAGLTTIGSVNQILGPSWQYSFTSVVVDKRWAEKNRDLLVRFLQARDDALRWINDPANRTRAIAILARFTRADTDDAARTYDLITDPRAPAFAERVGIDSRADANVLQVMERAGLVQSKGSNVARFTDDTYAAEARRLDDQQNG